MALNSQAALLDQLMGMDRNSTRKREINWDDEIICKYYLAGFCPHELFVNTRMSLGTCSKIHDTVLLSKYRDSSSYLKVGYERKLQRFLQSFVRDIESKIKYNEEKLVNGFKSGTLISIQKRIQAMELEITELVKEIERLGNEGKIGECQSLHTQLEEKQKQFRYDKIELERQKTDSLDTQGVCKICGAYTTKNDLKNSLENHVSGKIHSGYVKINEVLKELALVLDESNEKSRHSRERSSSGPKKDRNSDRGHHSRSKDDVDYRHRDRDRDRSHHKKSDRHSNKHHRDSKGESEKRERSRHTRHTSPNVNKHKAKTESRKRNSTSINSQSAR